MKHHQIESNAVELMSKARNVTGIFDIIDSSIEEGLTVLLDSLNTEAELNERGAKAETHRLLRLLSNRLRMQRDLRAHPEIEDQPIIGPVLLMGGPRTGSTKLHKMLAASGAFLYLPFWQGHCLSLLSGKRDESVADRVNEAAEYIRWIEKHAPDAQRNHPYGTYEPEEEILILEHFMCSIFPTAFANAPSFMRWWLKQDFRPQAEFLKLAMKYLQWQFHDGDRRPWLLKAPMIYHGVETVMAEVFPDVKLINTNRHPAKTVVSTANLIQGYRKAYSDSDWRRILGPMYLEGMASAIDGHLAIREMHPQLQFLDIGYAELTEDAGDVARKIFSHIGMPMSTEAERRMSDWEKVNQHPSRDIAQYPRPEDYSLTESAIISRFARYIERFRPYF